MRTLSFPIELDAIGQMLVIDQLDALRQKIVQRLSLVKGTWIVNINSGVPYLTDILTKPVDPGLVASLINAEIMKESEVTSIGSVSTEYDPNSRKMTYSATVYSIYGELQVDI